ncbi:MAG: hypothetical protein Athens041674_120 [Parcubacteria group bacterium Athens0416_74]|nr:MAG: hypothetical protein Athens041674_120 [Parcubacteria group bacterium Athens0416_74]
MKRSDLFRKLNAVAHMQASQGGLFDTAAVDSLMKKLGVERELDLPTRLAFANAVRGIGNLDAAALIVVFEQAWEAYEDCPPVQLKLRTSEELAETNGH